MNKPSKRYLSVKEKVQMNKTYSAEEATALVKELATAKFDETIEAHFRLGIDPRKSDQNVRNTVSLPHGTGKTIRILAFAKGDKAGEAKDAGADYVGEEEFIKKVLDGWLDFDAVVSTPDMMAAVGSKLGRVLGPRGLLPNPKAGTVGPNIGEIIKALKAGRVEFRNDKTGVVHVPIGKKSFEATQLADNLQALKKVLESTKPENSKGQFIQSLYLTPTMGPSVKVTL